MARKSAFIVAVTLDKNATTYVASNGHTGAKPPTGCMHGEVEFDASNGPMLRGQEIERDLDATGLGHWIRKGDF